MAEALFPLPFAPFADIAPWAVAGVFVSHFFGCFIRGAFGFGSNVPIVLLTTWLLGPHHAILLAVMTGFVAQFHLIPQGLKTVDWQVARPLLGGLFVGVAVGTWAFTILATDWLTVVMGSLIAVIVVMDQFRLLQRLDNWIDLRSKLVTSTLATTAGTVGAVSGGGAFYFLVAYLKLTCATPASLRGTNIITSGLFMSARLAMLVVAGLISLSLLAETVLLVPVVFAATWTGTNFFRSSSPERFYAALQFMLLAMAAALVVKGILKIL
jgi:uncharacterized membrane protein YfcA